MALSPLSTSNSTIKIANAALIELGVPKISSLTAEGIAARTINEVMADAIEEALSMYPWRFARQYRSLVGLSDPPVPPWSGMYAFPSDALVLHKAYNGDAPCEFDVFGRAVAVHELVTSPAIISAEITVYVAPADWPGYFRRAFIFHLASSIAMPLTQDEKTANRMMQLAQAKFSLAKSRDSQNRTATRLDTKAFIRARRGRMR